MTKQIFTPVIFLAFANDRGSGLGYLRNLPEEARQLRDVVEKAAAAGLCEVVIRQNVTTAELLDVFQDARYRDRIALFHFGGHANGYQLLLETVAGQPALADAGGLAAFLGQQTGLELAFLNGCSTQEQAQALLDAGVSVVIATSQAINDAVATDFATRFYQGLASGASIQTAFNEAVAASKTAQGGQTRQLYYVGAEDQPVATAERWPWALYQRPGAERAAQWNLPQAVNDPLFGLPELPAMDLPAKPFRDLSWFRRSDAPIFFGRGHQIRELYSAVTDHTAAPLVLFYGQSGVGKSSLLDAGLLPRLEQAHSVVYMRRDQEHGLLGTLLANLPGKAHVPDLAPAGWRTAEQQANKPVTLILDQVEEHFTRPNPALPQELEQFLTALNAIFGDRSQRPQGKLILSFRKEWLAEIEKQLSERGLPFDKIFLERLDEAGVIEAVSGVARRPALQRTYSLSVEEGLATEIANDLLKDRTAPVAPMLQILLTRLWEEATQRDRAKPCFDRTLYDQLRRDGLRLYEFLDRQLERLRQQQQEVVESGLALDLLSFHTTPLGTAEQHEYTALQREYHHRADSLPTLLQHFQNLYLLVDPANDQANSTLQSRLAHDTLAPLVRARFDESDLPGQRARRILESRAGEWDGVDDPSSPTPLDRQDLSVVEAGATGMRAWREAEERLVAASRLARQQLEQRERLIRRLFWGAAMAILLAAGAAGWQWQVASHNAATANAESTRADQNAQDASRQKETAQAEATRALNAETTAEAEAIRARQAQADAEHEAALARSRQLAAQSASELANHQYEPALLLAIEAGSAADTVEAFAAIRTALEQPARIVRLFPGHADWVNAIDWNRDRTRFLTASRDGTARLWDIQSGAELVQVKSVYDSPERILWSPDERSFVTLGASYGSTLQLWDAIDGNERFALVREGISDVQWSTNGRTLLTASVDGTIRSYAADDGSLRTTIPVSPTPVDSARWNQTETRILSVSADGVARLWNAATGRLIATLSGDQQNWIRQALWGPAGGQLLTSSNHGDIAVWGAEAGQQLFTLANDEGAQRVAAWRPDGTEILTGSYSGTIAIWDASTGIQLHIAQPNGRRVRHVAWNRTGTRFLTTGGDGVQIWERDGVTPLLQLATEDGWALADWNESEEIIYTIGSRQAQVWNAETGAAYLPPGSEAELIVPDPAASRALIADPADHTVRLWAFSPGSELPDGPRQSDLAMLAPSVLPTAPLTATVEAYLAVYPITPTRRIIVVTAVGENAAGTQAVIADSRIPGGALWDSASQQRHFTFAHTPVAARWNAAASQLLTANDDGTATVWDGQDGSLLQTLSGHVGPVRDAIWNRDESRTLTFGDDGTVRVWPGDGGPPLILQGHTKAVTSAGWNDDERLILTTSADNTVRVWDAATGDEKMIFSGAAAPISRAGWVAGGRQLWIADARGKVRHYFAYMDDLLTVACQQTPRALSQEEWQAYVKDIPYHNSCQTRQP